MIRGDIWWADFGIPFGSEPGFRRPVLILQDDHFNRSQIRTIVVIPFTTNLDLEFAPGNVLLAKETTRLTRDSVAVVSQIYSIDRTRLIERISVLDDRSIYRVEEGVRLVLGLK